jgi:IS5 family transposase
MSTDDFFRARLETMIDMRHPLAVLATRMPWQEIEAALAPVLAHKDRAGVMEWTPPLELASACPT